MIDFKSYSTHRSAGGAHTLAGLYYTSPEVFERELERVFYKRWICAGRSSRIVNPGDYFVETIGRESLIVTRDSGGAARAFYNVCRHRGTRLCGDSSGQFAGRIQCPYHAWTFALDGRLIGAPNMSESAGFRPEDYPLHAAHVHEWNGFLFLNLDANPEPFEKAYDPLIRKIDLSRWQVSELQVVHSISYDIRANWKLAFQNYSECYHCPKLHSVLSKLTPYRDSWNYFDEGPILGGPMRLAAGPGGSMTMDGKACAQPLAGVAGEDLGLIYYFTVFPTLFLSLHPDYVLAHRVQAISADHTRIVCDWLFHPDQVSRPGFDPQPAIDFWNMTNREDWMVSELSQQGVSSRAYDTGPYSQLESLLAAFDRHYLRLMEGASGARAAGTLPA
jgi:Rieske 2Fe-2S family protein